MRLLVILVIQLYMYYSTDWPLETHVTGYIYIYIYIIIFKLVNIKYLYYTDIYYIYKFIYIFHATNIVQKSISLILIHATDTSITNQIKYIYYSS